MEEKDKDKTLSDRGIIYLSGSIDDSSAESICKDIIVCNVKEEVEQIQMIINSSGGLCSAGFSIIDIMEWSRIPVSTTGIGLVASMSLLIFMAGEKGKRVISPRTSILSHRYYSTRHGSHGELVAGRKQEDIEYERIVRHYLEHTGVKDRNELESTLLKQVDTWLTPEEAVRYGIADMIEQKKRSLLRLSGLPKMPEPETLWKDALEL